MKQDIRFKGLTLNRDEQSAEPGELSLCGNVEVHDGALRPSVLEGSELAAGDTIANPIIFVHTTAMYRHFISHGSGGLYYSKEGAGGWNPKETLIDGTNGILTATTKISSITAVGNTLVMMVYDTAANDNKSGIHYFLCSESGGSWSYTYLGTQPPFIELQFSLKRDTNDTKNRDDHTLTIPADERSWTDGVPNSDGAYEIDKTCRATVTEQVMAKVNHRIDKLTGDGYFYAPFLIRYCYRMYDGAFIMHSPPVMMLPMLHHPVQTSIKDYKTDSGVNNTGHDYDYYVFLLRSTLQVKRLTADLTGLEKWKDIVTSVDIFITPQYSRIDTSEQIKTISLSYRDTNISFLDGARTDVESLFETAYTVANNRWGLDLPEISEEEYFSRLKNASSFFLLTSIVTERLASIASSQFEDLEFDKYKLKSITAQTQMKDDYKTHNRLIPIGENVGGMYVYNHRLNVYGISEILFEGFSPAVMFPYIDHSVTGQSTVPVTIKGVSVCIKTEYGKRKFTLSGSWDTDVWLADYGYVFYPDSRGVLMDISYDMDSGGVQITSLTHRKLESATELNGSMAFMSSASLDVLAGSQDPVPMPNKVYTSRADNPFYFPNLPDESGINTIGVGEIVGLGVATRALSQGQVGDHDLIAFCSDGIWVLKVSPTGTYSNMHNISREVCSRATFICQLDQSVLFATNRGLVRIVESDVVSMTEVLDGPFFDVASKMTELYNFYASEGTQQDPNPNYDADMKMLMDFKVKPANIYFNNGSVLYDFTGSRIIVLPETMTTDFVALVFSIRDGKWSTMCMKALKAAVNSYPCPYIQSGTGKVLRLDKPYDNNPTAVSPATVPVYAGLIVTRTLTFSDTRDVLRGFRQYCDCPAERMPLMFLYGSNDQITWTLIGTTARSFYNYLPGRPYRFFRIAMHLSMTTGEKYQSLALEVINKYAKL